MTDITATPTHGAPVKATWIVLAVAWACFIAPIPGAGMFVGWPLNLVAFILAIVVISRGRTGAGITQIICSLIVSPIIYFLGWTIFAGLMAEPNGAEKTVSMVLHNLPMLPLLKPAIA